MSDEWVMVPREASEAMIRAGYSAPTVFGVRDMANTYRAMLAAAPDAPQRNREADRARYIDRAFNEWLDDSVADGGATVWDLVSDVHSAWAAWTAHPHYAAPAAPQQAEPVAWRTAEKYSPDVGSWFDYYDEFATVNDKTGLQPLYLHPPPAAPVQQEPGNIEAFRADLIKALDEPDAEMLAAFQQAFSRQLHRRRHKPGLESAELAGIRALLKVAMDRERPPAEVQRLRDALEKIKLETFDDSAELIARRALEGK